MVRTLQDDLADDLAGSFLQIDQFAETITLDRNGKESVSVRVAIVDDGDIREDGHVREWVRELQVDIPRNATTGITTPAIGDSFVWSVDGKRYAFTGEVIQADPYWLKLRFRRRHTYSVGGQQQSGAS